MRDYGKVTPQFWIGDTGKGLRGHPDLQVLALYLMTSPHAEMTGVYHCPILYMAHETGMDIEGASKALASLIERGFCEYDKGSDTVFVVRMAAFQIGAYLKPNDKQVIGLRKRVGAMPEGRIKSRFLAEYGDKYQLSAPSKTQGPCKPLRSQEKEQEQEQEQEKKKKLCPQADGFDRFWHTYPRHENKRKAKIVWKSKSLDRMIDLIVDDVERRKREHRPWIDGFVPHPTTYLNGERWDDDIERPIKLGEKHGNPTAREGAAGRAARFAREGNERDAQRKANGD